MPRQVYMLTNNTVGLTYFVDINSVGEVERQIAIPSFATQGNTRYAQGNTSGFSCPVVNNIAPFLSGVTAKLSYDALVNITSANKLNDVFSILQTFYPNGQPRYLPSGNARGIYLASANIIKQLPDLTDCKIPVVHIAMFNPQFHRGLLFRSGYIHLTPKHISIVIDESQSEQAVFTRLTSAGGLFQIIE